MMLYILYRVGVFLALALPLGISYRVAVLLADGYYLFSGHDKAAVKSNIQRVLGRPVTPEKLDSMTREVFRNFAKYLVDFFRFSLIDASYIKKFVSVEGVDNINAAISRGRGVILVSAHIGNWELGASAVSRIGYPVSAVVLTHQNKRINDFFRRQRRIGGVNGIEIGSTLKSCYTLLKGNGILALLGDRDFTKNGLFIEFFGKETLVPQGPAALSSRLGAAIVPTFMLRRGDDAFTLSFEEPIYPSGGEEGSVADLVKKYLAVIERYIKGNPTQWYVFKDIWKIDDKFYSPDTII